MDVNLKGVWLGCKAGIPAMLASGGGSIVNVASFVALMGAATAQIAYTASKGGVLAMTREIAVEYARQGIRANALCPGPIQTPLLEELLSRPERRGRAAWCTSRWAGSAQAEELAKAALFLASDDVVVHDRRSRSSSTAASPPRTSRPSKQPLASPMTGARDARRRRARRGDRATARSTRCSSRSPTCRAGSSASGSPGTTGVEHDARRRRADRTRATTCSRSTSR